ncbi:hypothetical protein [Pararhizobium gei]|uniref:hypothetical protein n=1 Tax=Pararhizobium gei TaxID=1395951 RepID=UPI0023DB6A9E|nr:hypothetical protein [Rhizobium gei]
MIYCDDRVKATWRLFGNRTRHCLRRLARAEKQCGDSSRAQTFLLLQVASASLEQGLPLKSVEHVAISAAAHMTLEIQRTDRKTVFQSLSQESQAKVLRLKEIEDERDDFRADESTQFYMGPIRAKRRNKTLQDPSSWDWQVEAVEAELEDIIRKRERGRLRRKSRWSMLIDSAVYLTFKKFSVSRISAVVAVSADALLEDLLEYLEFEKFSDPDDPDDPFPNPHEIRLKRNLGGNPTDRTFWTEDRELVLMEKFKEYTKSIGTAKPSNAVFLTYWLDQVKFTDTEDKKFIKDITPEDIRNKIRTLKQAEKRAEQRDLDIARLVSVYEKNLRERELLKEAQLQRDFDDIPDLP